MHGILKQIEKLNTYKDLEKELKMCTGEHAVFGVTGAQRFALVAALVKNIQKTTVIVASNDKQAISWINELEEIFPKQVFYFPESKLRMQSLLFADSHDINKLRIQALCAMEKERSIIVTTVTAITQKIPSPKLIEELSLSINTGEEVNLTSLIEKLIQAGYERKIQVEDKAQFSVRGSIIDVFPINYSNPVRIELFGDEIDSIRYFEVSNQRTVEITNYVEILPASDLVLNYENYEQGIKLLESEIDNSLASDSNNPMSLTWKQDLSSIKEKSISQKHSPYAYYFLDNVVTLFKHSRADILTIWDDPIRLEEKNRDFIEEIKHDQTLLKSQKKAFLEYENLVEDARNLGCILTLSLLTRKSKGHQPEKIHTFISKEANHYHGQINFLVKDIRDWIKNGFSVILSIDKNNIERVKEYFSEEHFDVLEKDIIESELPKNTLVISSTGMMQGFEIPELKLVLLTETEIFGQPKKRKHRFDSDEKAQKRLLDYRELEVGDYVVHVSHGIGIYQGIRTMEINQVQKDYLSIRYKGKDRLYVPIDQIHLVQKYVGAEGHKPKVYSLGTSEWQRVKSRVKQSIQDMAKELLVLYAEREKAKGYAFPEDTEWQKDFEESFIYQETQDQIKVTEEIKHDMTSDKPMDRLLCGDVGFGKTEVALRAAFKAATSGKQVAILVPTTILAHQHYQTLIDRMRKFPINIAMMSRFRSKKENDSTIDKLNRGLVDIVVGTHSLLTSRLKFKDLGLLIIDEEQRFGVRHKEKIKELKTNIDVLSLSATPIPRTLHMSMVGMRDLSIIETPPSNRYPIQTYVVEYQDRVVEDAIKKEIERNGQIYYLHNRVRDIEHVAAKLERIIPEARIAVGHGQMGERQLEKIMIDFHNQEYDVLVSTTIIESGIDIPNVNTLIIDDADNLGLAQLYQIRGRVGRTDRLAYAYLTYKRDKVLSEVAEKRLNAIKEFTELGSGFKIALRDMQIRGAGNILGPEQSGFMIQVGYDLYVQLLEEAVNDLKGIITKEKLEVDIDLGVNAFIPDRYIASSEQKIEMYKKIIAIKKEEDAFDVMDELIDRFGDPPMAVRNLILISEIKSLAEKLSIKEIKGKGLKVELIFSQDSAVSPVAIQKVWEENRENLEVIPDDNQVKMRLRYSENISPEKQLNNLKSVIEKIDFDSN
jgi:transcription-repair coupling factor (superfamily II helicase)